jgi:hypothetical protein
MPAIDAPRAWRGVVNLRGRFAVLWLAVALGCPVAAAASELKSFNAAVADAYGHYRGAVFYLRTGNAGVAAVELAQMASKWRVLVERFAATPPDAFADDATWRATLDGIAVALATASAAAERGEAEGARHALAPVRAELAALRRRNNIAVFSDCVDELGGAMEALWRYRHEPPDFDSGEAVDRLKARLGVVEYLFQRCRDRAPTVHRESEDFNRLIDGSLESLKRLWAALARQDGQAVINSLRELRSFDAMLFLRYG